MGEVAYIRNGIRYTLPAKSMEEKNIHRSDTVIIREISGSVAIVQQKLTLDDIEINSDEFQKGENNKPRRDAGNN